MSGNNKDCCPICGSELEIIGTMEKCSMCGYSATVKSVKEKKDGKSADDEIKAYRLMSSADTFFSKKSYEEAYVGYGAVLDADGSSLKARFRRELTSQYLMMESSSVYLGCDSFFDIIKEVKRQLIEMGDEKLSFTVCRDMLDFISARADYEKRYASLHKNEKTAAMYMSDTIRLFEYTAETVVYLKEKGGVKDLREWAFLVSDGCTLGMKLRAMLLSGAEYVETTEKMDDLTGEPSAKNISRIKRRKLSQDEELQVETLAGNMRKIKKELLASVSGELFTELKAASDKSEKTEKTAEVNDDKKRLEYETWRSNNEKEYAEADKRILIFGIVGKAAAVMTAIMIVMFLAELIFYDVFMNQLIVIAAVFIACGIAMKILRRNAVKKKGFYSKVIEGDSVNLRSSGKDFREL